MPTTKTTTEDLYESLRRSVRVAVAVRVERYDAASQTADVLVLVNEERMDGDTRVPIGPIRIPGAPVVWPAGASRGLSMGLEVGETALAVVRHRSHDEVDAGSVGSVNPASTRRMNYSDAIVIPGYFAPDDGRDASQFRSDGQPVLAMPGGEAVHIGASTATYALVRWDLLDAYLKSLKTAYDAHVHPVPGGTSGAPANPAPTVTDMSTTRVKVDA